MRSKTHGAPSGGPIDAYLALAYGDLSGRLKGAYVLIGHTPITHTPGLWVRRVSTVLNNSLPHSLFTRCLLALMLCITNSFVSCLLLLPSKLRWMSVGTHVVGSLDRV